MPYHYDNETKNHGSSIDDVARAINLSKLQNETVELPYSISYAESLLVECEGHDDNGAYWGVDCDGNEWQVRLVERDAAPMS
jgi:hypothetical protein